MKYIVYSILKNAKFIISYLIKLPILLIRRNRVSFSCRLNRGLFISNSNVGKYTYIGINNIINYTDIGNYCSIASDVQIGGMEHSYWALSTSTFLSNESKSDNRTYIGHDVWIAAGCIIKQGVTIGDGAVIGANSFVTKDVEPYSIVFGTPAKHYKYRFDEDVQKKLSISRYWDNKPRKAREILTKIANSISK